jgi:hypothetical protein
MKKTMQSKYKKIAWWQSWKLYFSIIILGVIVLFTLSEKFYDDRQPSDDWSLGYEIDNHLSSDIRKQNLSDGLELNTVVHANIHGDDLTLSLLDGLGQVVQKKTLEGLGEGQRVIQVEAVENAYILYRSDRQVLERIVLSESFEVQSRKILTTLAHHFHAHGNWVITGNSEGVLLFEGEKKVYTFDVVSLEQLFALRIKVTPDNVYAFINANSGGTLYNFTRPSSNENFTSPIANQLMRPRDQEFYGYIADIYESKDQLTVMTHFYDHLNASGPATLGVWHLVPDTLEQKSVYYYYHPRTALKPQILSVEGEAVTYVLGTLQTVDPVNKGLSRYPQTRGGTFTNISRFTREGDRLIENTRLTATRKYPIGYYYTALNETPVLLWLDRYANSSTLYAAGSSPEWIQWAVNEKQVNWLLLVGSSLMAFSNSLFFGALSLFIMLGDFNTYMVFYAIGALVFLRFGPFGVDRRKQLLLWLSIAATVAMKWYVFGYQAVDLKMYGFIYPTLFGSSFMLQATALVGSFIAIGLLQLWKREHPYYPNPGIHFGIYIAFEAFFLLSITMAFFVSALMKANFLM